MQLSKHFKLKEFTDLQPSEIKAEHFKNLQKLVLDLEVIRAYCGGKPLIIHSGLRSQQHNAEVGGASKSYHLTGQAVDFHIQGQPVQETRRKVNYLSHTGLITPGGVGEYPHHVHYDIRGKHVYFYPVNR